MIATYPEFSDIIPEQRPELHPLFRKLKEGISEFTFADIYLFRETHNYSISRIREGLFAISGRDDEKSFFMLPFGLAEKKVLDEMFDRFGSMKCVSESQASRLSELGYTATEDRDNFDYLYSREDMVKLPGAKFHKKRNLIRAFIDNYSYEGRPLLTEHTVDAIKVLDWWRDERGVEGDYAAAREALKMADELQLCGGIYYVDGEPAAYSLGEELAGGKVFVIHFEKALSRYKGLYQFINNAFASILPRKYEYINREQDLGDEGLRQAKMTYRPAGFVKKFRVEKP